MKVKNIVGIKYMSIAILFMVFAMGCSAQREAEKGWKNYKVLVGKIIPPTFPNKDFSILDYGAKAGGSTDCLPAIKSAIDACNKAGGGRVMIPAGTFFVKGPIHLLSNVNLHLDDKAILKFSTNDDDYLPNVVTRFEGVELMNYSPLVYAYGQTNIAVTGKGTLDGQADNEHWWNWTGSKRFGWKEGMPKQHDPENEPKLMQMAAEGVPVEDRVFGKGYYMRPTMVEFYKCKNILIEGVTLINAPFWLIHPTLSQ
ncbi:MAG TPA: glycosyl hydrolase family 28-related protein, partial [Hanamia sp.]|nr:glycosyl hydrolase family 28-related protein [Hanamia sp.]